MDPHAHNANTFVIKAANVPHEFFENRDVAKRYFRRFGKVKLVMFKPKRNSLIIEYANEDSMLNALDIAGEYKGHVFNVTRDTESVLKKKKAKKETDPDWTPDPEVRAELEAMGAFGSPRAYDLRAEAMNVDPVEPAKSKQRRWGTAQKKKPSSEHLELVYFIRQQAHTVEDRFRILDARDKLIRIKLKRSVELSRATVGTCPDMCPEKERLMREVQHQVSLYEADSTKGMNPRLAVKQYSRSSADQEAPLPQELRPVNVLQMTMGYLMHRILGLCDSPDVNIAEWFHFLWDRTRGIRKDITQQELCSQGSAELVEQCARFHIFCSARLVSEDPSVFDQKINTENLTKCLQTLKYMYHDLQLKGESCRNEPEFRAYIILLNLNDGNFMWEVQQLKKDIQRSREVKFALEVYSSLDKRNYVKFFKLVNSTTFLNACILMRYFVQVRISAMKTLLKSYSPRISQTSLPVQYLTKVLAFESPESTIEFFESYGLYTNVERTRLILDKVNFAPPDFPYVLDRAVNLVESKLTRTIGEVICGRELPPRTYEHHTPQDSFDHNGYLKVTPELDEILQGEEPMRGREQSPRPIGIPVADRANSPRPFGVPVTERAQSPRPFGVPIAERAQSPRPFGVPIVERADSPRPFGVREKEELPRPIPVPTGKPHVILFKPTTPSPIFRSVPQEPAPVPEIDEAEQRRKLLEAEEIRRREQEEQKKRKQLAEEEERRKREELKARLRKEEEEKRKREAEDEARRAALRKKLEEQRRLEQERRKNVEIKAAVCNVISELLDHVEEDVKEAKLAEIRDKMHRRKMKRAVAKWKENTRRKRKRKALDFNPLWFGGKSVQEEARELRTGSQALTLSSMKRYKRGKPLEIHLSGDDDMTKIDLPDLTYKLLTKRFMEVEIKLQNELFWKVTVSLPNELEFKRGLNHLERVLGNYTKWEKRGGTTVLIQQSKGVPTVTYCLEKQQGSIITARNETDGFIFVADDFNEELRKRIVHNFRNFGDKVKIPIVLVLQNYPETNLEDVISEGVPDYLILVDKFTSKNLINLVEEALIFLSTRVDRSPPLQMDTLKSFLAKHLCHDLWKRANSFAKWNCNYKNCLKSPATAIYLHNEALSRLRSVLSDPARTQYARFPDIFKDFLRSRIPDALPCDYRYFPSFWDCHSYLDHVDAVLKGLKLANFLEDWPPASQLELEAAILKYCAGIVKEPQKCFYKVMSVLLKGELEDVVWSDVVELLVSEKLDQVDFSLYGTGFVNKSVFNQLVVVYNEHTLSELVRSDWFYVDNPVVKHKILGMLQEEAGPEEEELESVGGDIDIDKIYTGLLEPANLDPHKVKNEMSACKRMLADLEEAVDVHKRILEKSGHLLRTIVENT